MTTIGYATMQVIPSLSGVEKTIQAQLGPVTKMGKSAGKQLGGGLAAGVAEAESAVKKSTAAIVKLEDKQADAIGKVRVAQEKLNDLRAKGVGGGRLAAAEEAHARVLRQQATNTRDLESETRRLARAQKDLDGARRGSADNQLSSLDKVKGSLAGMAGPASVAAGAVAAIGAAAVVVGRQLYDIGAQFDDMADTIAVKTGAAGSDLDSLVGSATRLGRTVPVAFGELGDVVAETNRNLHLTGPELESVAKTLANLGRITGEQVDIRSLGKAFRSFGVDEKDQEAALDGLYTASTNTGLSVNELISSVVKGGPALRQFGLGFGESAALVTTFEAAGLDADKGLSALNKALATLADEGKTGPDALKGLVGDIQNLVRVGDEAGAQDLTNKFFGSKGGVNFFELIKTGRLDLEQLAGGVDTAGLSINAVADRTNDAAEQWQVFKNRALEAVEPFASDVFGAAGDGLEDLAAWTTEHKDDIVGFFTTAANAGAEFGGAIVGVTGGTIQAFGHLVGAVGDTVGFMLDGFESMVGGAATVAEAFGLDGLSGELRGAQSDLAGFSDQFHGWGEDMVAFGDNVVGAAFKLHDFDAAMLGTKTSAENAAAQADHVRQAIGQLPDGKQIDINAIVIFKDASGLVIPPDQLRAPTYTPAVPGETQRPRGGGRAGGGDITGPGGPKSDIIPIWASNGEHMWTAEEVDAVGGQDAMYRMRAAARAGAFGKFSTGGAIGGAVDNAKKFATTLDPATYLMGGFSTSAIDCSGLVSAVVNVATGRPPFQSRMSTVTEGSWLQGLGFKLGRGSAGDLRVGWWDKGGGANGHTAGTFPDGTNFESNGSEGVVIGGPTGAGHAQFSQHAYLPGAAPAVGDAAGRPSYGVSNTGDSGAVSGAPVPAEVGASGSSSGGGSNVSIPTSLTGLSSFGLDSLGAGVGTTSSGSDLSLFGKAAGSAVSGQVGSLMGVFGVGDSPGWLTGINKLIGGISIGGSSGGGSGGIGMPHLGTGAAPGPLSEQDKLRPKLYDTGGWVPRGVSLTENRTSGPEPLLTQDYWRTAKTGMDVAMAMVKGQGGSNQQAPQVNYTINARDTEDAFIRAQRQERERAAAKLSRF